MKMSKKKKRKKECYKKITFGQLKWDDLYVCENVQ